MYTQRYSKNFRTLKFLHYFSTKRKKIHLIWRFYVPDIVISILKIKRIKRKRFIPRFLITTSSFVIVIDKNLLTNSCQHFTSNFSLMYQDSRTHSVTHYVWWKNNLLIATKVLDKYSIKCKELLHKNVKLKISAEKPTTLKLFWIIFVVNFRWLCFQRIFSINFFYKFSKMYDCWISVLFMGNCEYLRS